MPAALLGSTAPGSAASPQPPTVSRSYLAAIRARCRAFRRTKSPASSRPTPPLTLALSPSGGEGTGGPDAADRVCAPAGADGARRHGRLLPPVGLARGCGGAQ